MRGLVTLVIISLFLIGFVGAISITSKAIDNSTDDDKENQVGTTNPENEDNKTDNKETNTTLRERIREKMKEKLDESQIKKIKAIKNRIRAEAQQGECPESCTCTGSVVKCQLASGKEITITAGKSGNTIVQVKGENMSTNVILYKLEGKIYGVFKNNETKIVRMLPDQVKERIREKIARRLEKENITLNENGSYQYDGEKRKKLFFFIPVKVRVRAEIDAETGEVISISKPKWWEFLAKDEGERIVGASCGTVTPGQNDECCQTKGYGAWDSETSECVFSE
jgi:hypothetical protein